MVFLAVLLYFLLACALSWMVLFPAGRAYVARRLELAGSRLQRRMQEFARRSGEQAESLGTESAMAVRQGGKVKARVEPELLDPQDPLAGMVGLNNALYLTTDLLGEVGIVQRGGSLTQTAYALLSDVSRIAQEQKEI